MSNKKGKPVILNDYRKEFDDEVEALIARNMQLDDDFDPMFIEGYTQVKKANDIAAVDDLVWANTHEKTGFKKSDAYAAIGANPRQLPVEFQAIRVVGMDGTHNANVSRDMSDYTRWGYRPAQYPEDFVQHGFGKPLGYTAQTDGTLRRDDLQLFVVDARAARAREVLIARRTAEMENTTTKVEKQSGVEFTGEAEKRFETITT